MNNKILNPVFLTSASCISQCPQIESVEIVCIGRSNVGKSSFINLFLGSKNLAKSSSTPGKTRLINFYEALYQEEEEKIPFRLVDLPGFGYAKVSKDQKRLWEKNLVDFLEKRSSIKLFLHLIDSRHLGLKIDQDVGLFLQSLARGDQKIFEIYTKADKLKMQEKNALLQSKKCLISTLNTKICDLQELRKKIIDLALGRRDDF